jgi:hypothetical protein
MILLQQHAGGRVVVIPAHHVQQFVVAQSVMQLYLTQIHQMEIQFIAS